MKKIITVVFGVTFLVLGFTACGGGDKMDVAMDAMENMLDVMENDLLPALEEFQGLQIDVDDIEDDGSESQQKRFEELEQRAEKAEDKFREFGIRF
ncbi:MAG: hypothetical protein QGF98_06455 [Candidatus Poseidoniia archaeon]|nr:hypothetical protein [Candidatus Poseidoniia archaeon]